MDVKTTDNEEKSRFEAHLDGELAGFAAYTVSGDRITFSHTEVDSAFSGQGIGGLLVLGALDAVRERGLAVLPECPFVRGWIAKHPDYVGLVPESERSAFDL